MRLKKTQITSEENFTKEKAPARTEADSQIKLNF